MLHKSAGPLNGGVHLAAVRAQSKKQLLAVLREETCSCLEELGLTQATGFDCDRGTNGVAVAFCAP